MRLTADRWIVFMELFETALFYFFAAILVVSAVCVVTAKNPVRAVLFLVLCFFNAAVLWIFLQAEFLAMILVLVYVGAVMVLFLFIVMMMDIDMATLKGIAKQNLAAAGVVGVLMVVELGMVLFRGFCHVGRDVPAAASRIGLTFEIGKVLFTDYLFHVELAAMILLVALIGAVALTLRKRTDARYTSAGDAVKVRAADRLSMVDLKSEQEAGNSVEKEGHQEGGRP